MANDTPTLPSPARAARGGGLGWGPQLARRRVLEYDIAGISEGVISPKKPLPRWHPSAASAGRPPFPKGWG